MASQEERDEAYLTTGRVLERPFSSTVPVVGPVIAGFRSLWNSVAAKWYVRPLLEQQNAFNTLMLQRLELLEEQMLEQEQRLLEQDREHTALLREAAELQLQLSHLNTLLAALNDRLAGLEAEHRPAGSGES